MPPSAKGRDHVTPQNHLTPKDGRSSLYSARTSGTSLSILNPNQISLDLQSGYYWFFFPVYMNLLKRKSIVDSCQNGLLENHHQHGCGTSVSRRQQQDVHASWGGGCRPALQVLSGVQATA